jgi:hypothetical protein
MSGMTGTVANYRFDSETFALAIREARGERTLRAFEESIKERVGSSPNHASLSLMESGATPNMETLCRLCTYLGRNPGSFFVGGSDWQETEQRMRVRIDALKYRLQQLEAELENLKCGAI